MFVEIYHTLCDVNGNCWQYHPDTENWENLHYLCSEKDIVHFIKCSDCAYGCTKNHKASWLNTVLTNDDHIVIADDQDKLLMYENKVVKVNYMIGYHGLIFYVTLEGDVLFASKFNRATVIKKLQVSEDLGKIHWLDGFWLLTKRGHLYSYKLRYSKEGSGVNDIEPIELIQSNIVFARGFSSYRRRQWLITNDVDGKVYYHEEVPNDFIKRGQKIDCPVRIRKTKIIREDFYIATDLELPLIKNANK